jgi:hypothetical protein
LGTEELGEMTLDIKVEWNEKPSTVNQTSELSRILEVKKKGLAGDYSFFEFSSPPLTPSPAFPRNLDRS